MRGVGAQGSECDCHWLWKLRSCRLCSWFWGWGSREAMISPPPAPRPPRVGPAKSLCSLRVSQPHASLSVRSAPSAPVSSFPVSLRSLFLVLTSPARSDLPASLMARTLLVHAVDNCLLPPHVFLLPLWRRLLVSFRGWYSLRFCARASFLTLHSPWETPSIPVTLGGHLGTDDDFSSLFPSLIPVPRSKSLHRQFKFKSSRKRLRMSPQFLVQ